MFSVHTTPVEFKNATISVHFGIVFEENSDREVTRDAIISENLRFQIVFRPREN